MMINNNLDNDNNNNSDANNYWGQLLQGADPESQTKDFPFDAQFDSEVENTLATSNCVSYPLPTNTKDALLKKGDDDASAVLSTAFAILVAKHTSKSDVVVGVADSTSGGKVLPLRCDFGQKEAVSVADITEQIGKMKDSAAGLKPEDEYLDFILTATPFKTLPEKVQSSVLLAVCPILAQGALEYNCDPDLISALSLKWIHTRFVKVLDQVLATNDNEKIDLSSMSLLSGEEMKQIDSFAHGVTRPIQPERVGFLPLFEEQAAAKPEAMAVKDDSTGQTLTYGELNTQAEKLASHLQGLSPGMNNPKVGVMMNRSIGLFVSLVATLKAGAAYVPIDPSYPQDRIEFILQDSDCKSLIIGKDCAAKAPVAYMGHVVCLEDFETTVDANAGSEERVKPQIALDDVMLVLYTSGTTGKPKGVALPHRSATYFVENNLWDCMNANDVWAQMANPCFIGSVNDIWLPLIKGACSVILPKDVIMDMSILRNTLQKHKISCLFLTPKILELAADIDPSLFDGLKMLQFAGEAVRLDAVVKLAGRVKHLQHLYGCTERMGCISGFEVTLDTVEDTPSCIQRQPIARLPIGLPIENTQMYVLDTNQKPVPIGMPGELYVGGPQITNGYINRDDATAEKFIPNPFDGGKMYRTGDMARWLPDGRGVDLMGRIDAMVKINGYRVELGEIEAAIMDESQLGVTAAVAIVRDLEGTHSKMLVAYVTPESVDVPKLRDQLKEKLPDYLLPKAIVAIPAIPLTHNGKLDRRALPSVEAKRTGQEHVEPATESERIVVSVWSKLLNIERVSVTDDFLALGGHSLLVMRVLNELKSHCPSLQISDLLENNMPRLIALRLDELNAEESGDIAAIPDCIVKFSRNKEDQPGVHPVFVIHGGSSMVDWAGGFNPHMSTRPLYGIRLTQDAVDSAAKHSSGEFFTGICDYYTDAIRAVQPHGPYKVGGNSLGALLAFEIAYILEKKHGEVVEQVISMDMPVGKFDKMAAYRTATSIHEKAPALLASTLGEFFCKDKELFQKELEAFVPKLDKEILEGGQGQDQAAVSVEREFKDDVAHEDRAFVTMNSTIEFLERVGMPMQDIRTAQWGLSYCAPLFVDLTKRGHVIDGDVHCAIASDNRLMAHTLKTSGMDSMLEDYGWSLVSHGKVTTSIVEGNHVDFVSTEEGKAAFGRILDA